MSQSCDLTNKHCAPCSGEGQAYSVTEAHAKLSQLHGDWQLSESGDFIEREFKFADFNQAVHFSNLICWLAERENHHPDICLGWGYCRVKFYSHKLGGLSENDFICAARVDTLARF